MAEALALFEKTGADYLRSVTAVEEHPHWMGVIDEGNFRFLYPSEVRATRRQDLPPMYRLNGAISILKTERILGGTAETGNAAAYVMDSRASIDIDTVDDFRRAERMLGAGLS